MTGSYTIMEEADPVTKRGDREEECMGNKDSFRNKWRKLSVGQCIRLTKHSELFLAVT